jgi:hypothetical protein
MMDREILPASEQNQITQLVVMAAATLTNHLFPE